MKGLVQMVERLYYNEYKMTDKSKDRVQALGFKKIYTEPDLYYYKFAVDKYKDIPTVWCKFTLDISTGEVQVDVLNSKGSFFPAFYQEAAGFDTYVEKINNKISPIQDDEVEEYLANHKLNLVATIDAEKAYKDAEFVIVAAPTNYDPQKNFFDTSAVETVIKLVLYINPNAIMVIKSTIPVGYTEYVRKKFNCKNIIFSPEFLRES